MSDEIYIIEEADPPDGFPLELDPVKIAAIVDGNVRFIDRLSRIVEATASVVNGQSGALVNTDRRVRDLEKLAEIQANTLGEMERRIEELEVAASQLHAQLKEQAATGKATPRRGSLGVVPGGITGQTGGAL